MVVGGLDSDVCDRAGGGTLGEMRGSAAASMVDGMGTALLLCVARGEAIGRDWVGYICMGYGGEGMDWWWQCKVRRIRYRVCSRAWDGYGRNRVGRD